MPSIAQAERLRILSRSPLFQAFPPPDLERLAGRMVERRYANGQTIFNRGEPGTCLFAVARGQVRLGVTSPCGRDTLIAVLTPGEVFGEMALLDGGTRSADATAAEGCLLLALDRRDFLPLLDGVPEVRWHLFHLLCTRLRSATERLERTLFLSVGGRLANLLLTLADRDDGRRVGLKLSQADLGRLIGASREKVNIELNAWLSGGVLSRDGRALVIRDRGHLAALAEAA
jgi:CRP/FNR family transcriptional regulator, cyclic AMP receptor protein